MDQANHYYKTDSPLPPSHVTEINGANHKGESPHPHFQSTEYDYRKLQK